MHFNTEQLFKHVRIETREDGTCLAYTQPALVLTEVGWRDVEYFVFRIPNDPQIAIHRDRATGESIEFTATMKVPTIVAYKLRNQDEYWLAHP